MWLFIPSRAARVNITAVRTPAAPGSQISTGTLFTHKTAAAGPRESGCSFHFHALFGFMSCINRPVICKHEIRGLESPTNQINTVYLTCACKPCLSRTNSLFMRGVASSPCGVVHLQEGLDDQRELILDDVQVAGHGCRREAQASI